MHPGEYEAMSRVERSHWWYRGLRDLLTRLLEAERFPSPPRLLDAGCGTGENLRLFAELLRPAYLGGFDTAEEALALAREKAPDADLYIGDICDPVLRVDAIDLLVSLDVIYIPGLERARAGLARLVERLVPGGLLLLNLPAYRWLYSEHDVAIHTRERYTAGEVRELLSGLGLRVELLTYRLFFHFPLVVLARLPRMLRARPGEASARSDLQRPPGPTLDRMLFSLLCAENALIRRGLRFPWGSSVFAIARKP